MATRRTQKPRLTKSPSPKRGEEKISVWRSDDRTWLAWTGAIFLIHALGVALLFDPVQGIVNGAPLIDQDWGLHFHHLKSMEAFWRENRSLWGYNPLFMAGYPSNTIQDLSIKLFELCALALSSFALTPVQWFKLLAFLAVASLPWLSYFAARNFFAERDDIKHAGAFFAVLLGTLYWWNSLPREMFFYGMLGFPLACYLALWGTSIGYRVARETNRWSGSHVAWLAFAIMVPSLHLQAAIVLIPPLAALLVAQPGLLRGRFMAWLVGGGVLSLAVNLVWLVPAVAHLQDDVSRSIVERLSLFVSADPLTFLKDYLAPVSYWSFRPTWAEKGLRLALLVLGVLGTVKLLRSEQKSFGSMLATALAALFFIAYFGSLLPLTKGWQPLRFKVAYDLFLIVAAAYAIASWSVARKSMPTPIMIPALIFGGVAFLVNLAATESLGNMRLRTAVRAEITGIVDWIKAETPLDGRVLFEESGDETGFFYDGMYLSSFIPHWTGRQLIGGPINLYNDRHHFAEFHSGKLLKKEIDRLGDDEIRNYFSLYNIAAVVAFHPASVRRLQSVAGLVTLAHRIGPVHLMKVNQSPEWFLQGSGKVQAALGRLELSEVSGREIILKFHWVEGLKGVPSVKIVPVNMDNDPIPFIKVLDPPAAFVLRIGE